MSAVLFLILAQAETAEHKVDATITDQVCVERHEFLFRNPTGAPIEHDFIMPVDPQAQATQFTMVMGQETVEARMLDKERAESIYREIVHSRRDPGLLEHVGRGMIRARIFPVPPNGEARVSLTLTRTLPSLRGNVRLTTLHSMPGANGPVGRLSFTANLRCARPIGTIYSPTEGLDIQRPDNRTARVEFQRRDWVPGKPLELIWSSGEGDLGVTLLAHRLPGERGYFMLCLSPRIELRDEDYIPKEVVFCVDTSGSMAGPKIEQAREALRHCVEKLPARDKFSIVKFSTTVGMFKTELVAATAEMKKEAVVYAERLQPEGGTDIDSSIEKSLALFSRGDAPKILVFVTDGAPTIGETQPDRIVENIRKFNRGVGAAIVVFGVGTDVKAPLLDRIAHDHRGSADYLLPHEDLAQKLAAFAGKIQGPLLSDVAVRFLETEVEELYPRDVSTLFADQQIVIVGRYLSEGDRKIAVTGRQGSRDVKLEFPVSFPKGEGQNEFLPRLWAGRKVGFLLGEIQRNGQNPELVQEVSRLAKLHGIVTPYTSYLALEKEHRERFFTGESARVHRDVQDPVVFKAPDDHTESPNDEEFHKAKGESLDALSDRPFKGRSIYDIIGAGGGGGGKYGGRFGGRRLCVSRGGGGKETEEAVLNALRWLARNQASDGSWDGGAEPTALALAAFLGAGYTHLSKDTYDQICFGEVLKRGLEFLMKVEPNDRAPGEHAAIACALAEAYGMTCSAMIKDAAEKSIATLARRSFQNESERALALLALKSGEIAGIGVDASPIQSKLSGALDRALYELLVARNKAAAKKHIESLAFPSGDSMSAFLATSAVYLFDGPSGPQWKRWNETMTKETTAALAKSADPLRVLALETYYRFPVTFERKVEAAPGYSAKEAEFHASRDSAKLARAEKVGDLRDAGGPRKSVGSKIFYSVNGVWVDSTFDPKTPDASIVRVKFMSAEYDALLKDAELARYLSAGTDVVVVHGGKIYWVAE
jgi:Ca-activated chloride channel family protein